MFKLPILQNENWRLQIADKSETWAPRFWLLSTARNSNISIDDHSTSCFYDVYFTESVYHNCGQDDGVAVAVIVVLSMNSKDVGKRKIFSERDSIEKKFNFLNRILKQKILRFSEKLQNSKIILIAHKTKELSIEKKKLFFLWLTSNTGKNYWTLSIVILMM